MDDRVTVAEAARILGYAERSIRHLYHTGDVTGERIGARMLLLDRSSVEAFAQRKRKPGRPKGWHPSPPSEPEDDAHA